MQPAKPVKIVILEDEPYYNCWLTNYIKAICKQEVYKDYHFDIKSYTHADECIRELEIDTSIMILDYYLHTDPEAFILTGSDVMEEVNRHCKNCKVILVSSKRSAHLVKELMQEGIQECVDKHVNSRDRVGVIFQRVMEEEFSTAERSLT